MVSVSFSSFFIKRSEGSNRRASFHFQHGFVNHRIELIASISLIRKEKEMINSFGLGQGGEQLLFTIFVMFVAAKLAAEIFERLKQPAVAGEILAGVVIGPSVLGLVAPRIDGSAFGDRRDLT